MNILFTWIFLLPFVSCKIVINHGDKQNFTTTIEVIDDDIRFQIDQELEDGVHSRKNFETEVEVRFDVPAKQSEDETIAVYESKLGKDGKNYEFYYSTSNINTREENGFLSKNSEGIDSLTVKGSYSYDNPGGIVYVQGYTADENGFRTKVSFGKNIVFGESVLLSQEGMEKPSPPPKQIDPVLLCSLIGSGCKK